MCCSQLTPKNIIMSCLNCSQLHSYYIVTFSIHQSISFASSKESTSFTFHLICCTHAISICQLARTSTNSPTLPVSELTFQVSTLNAQPSSSLSTFLPSCSQHCALTQRHAAFWLVPPTSFLHRHMWAVSIHWLTPNFLIYTCQFSGLDWSKEGLMKVPVQETQLDANSLG